VGSPDVQGAGESDGGGEADVHHRSHGQGEGAPAGNDHGGTRLEEEMAQRSSPHFQRTQVHPGAGEGILQSHPKGLSSPS